MAEEKKRGKNFTAAERRAFNEGRGYAAAKAGQKVPHSTKEEKDSFRAGMKSVREK